MIIIFSVVWLGVKPVSAAVVGQFADVSEWQPDTQDFYNKIADYGISGVVVKLTMGQDFVNPKAAKQIQAAKNLSLKVSFYHHAKYQNPTQAIAEANFFAGQVQKYGYGLDTVMVDDVEDNIITNTYNDTIVFQNELARLGYHNQVIYSMASWFWYNKLPRNYPTWVAHFNVADPGVSNITAWQYTNHFNNLHLDASYDYEGLFTNREPVVRINYIPGYGIMLWNGYDPSSRQPSGRYLKHGTGWKVTAQAKVEGHYWYQVAKNQWIQADYTTNPNGFSTLSTILPNSDPNGFPIATINYFPGYGIMLWNGYENNKRQQTGRYLPDGSSWKISAQALVNGKYWYEVATNQWIQANFTTNPKGFNTLKTIFPNSDPNGDPIATIKYIPDYGIMLWDGYNPENRQATGRYLPDGSDWKITAQVKVNGEYWYEVATNQWIPAQYTTNPNGFTKVPTLEG